ncbi:uncharacterized protein LOC132757534 [Ruditapes philippinarum]|uniref:uncharacterized protein LOC132757534 n=1 Tax=Ruditapes philippinarum TaxID=129788 RepID=UPI00295B2317|nr:uncharacterized protein LOC132757534 [Ruditapes philippinarum]
MKCLFVFTICALVGASVRAHLHGDRIRMQHQQLGPFGQPFGPHHNMLVGHQQMNDPFFTNPGMLGGGIITQGGFPNFGQWPNTFNNQHAWNNGFPGVSPLENNGFNSNVMSSTDPWEQYRRFNTGVHQSLSGGRLAPTGNTFSSTNQVIPGTGSNYPWNTFATQNIFGTNVPSIPNNQGFVNPQFQSNVNQFQNQGFLSQGFPNNNRLQNQGFLSQGFPNNNQFQNQGSLTQGLPNGLQLSNGAFK